jgi:hypothetical protein
MKCAARQHSDQKVCAACGLVWDINDPEPPTCPREQPAKVALAKIKRILNNE